MTLEEFIRQNRHADVSALALRMRQYPEMDAAFALQQIEGWQRAEHKLPELASIEGWLWPKRLSLEQCSSEVTAKYKRAVLGEVGGELVDLTGGLGVDTYYLSEGFGEVHYVERQRELCELAEKNFALAGKRITVHCCEAEAWLKDVKCETGDVKCETGDVKWETGDVKCETGDVKWERVIFIDPARRDAHGGKVFRLEDCEPNVVAHLSLLRACARRVLMKLSPMLDITAAVRSLGGAAEVHVVAVRNEVKEVLVLLEAGRDSLDPEITCVNLETEEPAFSFRKSEEEGRGMMEEGRWMMEDGRGMMEEGRCEKDETNGEEFVLVEPNAAIMKAGAFRVFGERFGLRKLGANSQLYVMPGDASCMQESLMLVRKRAALFAVPGRIFCVKIASKEDLKNIDQANVICRNYPLSPEALKKKLRVRDGGEKYVIATKIGTKPVIFLGVRQFLHT